MIHSLYFQYFDRHERRMLAATSSTDVSSEINLLRVLTARLLATSADRSRLTLKQSASILAAFSDAGTVIAALVRLYLKLRTGSEPSSAGSQIPQRPGRRPRAYDFLFYPPPAPDLDSDPQIGSP
jgi:hypothetical protein